jgi:ribulose-5-phosphate 4-epimerase/fuculose-1-phosphate aldolase
MSEELNRLKLELAVANRILANEGVVDALGHISARSPLDPTHFFISRSLGPELVTPDDIQEFGLDGDEVHGDPRAPYAERAIHAQIYAARSDVLAVCHNHAPSVIPFGIMDVPLRPVFHMAATIGAHIPVWDIAAEFGDTDLLVRSSDQAASLARTLGTGRVVLMRGHGCAIAGGSVPEVVFSSIYLEVNARLQLQTLGTGRQPQYLSQGEIELASATLLQPLTQERTWTTWARRISVPGEPAAPASGA